jgi:hypothetical protein
MAARASEDDNLSSRLVDQSSGLIWRDDIASPVSGPRLTDILLDPRNAYSCPERIAGHLSLSVDAKRLALCTWLRDLLADARDGLDVGPELRRALAELSALDPAAADVFRRAFAGQGLALDAS